MSTYQSASYWQFRIQGSIEQVLHNHQAVAEYTVYETASSSQIDKLTSTISLSGRVRSSCYHPGPYACYA